MAGPTLFPSILPDGADDVDVDELLEAGECPWCDYDDGNPKQHAPRAHSEEWTAHTEG